MKKSLNLIFTFLLFCLLSACIHTKPNLLGQSQSPSFDKNTKKSDKIAQFALYEHQVWGQSFINQNGQIAKYSHYESANTKLKDGSLAWERVFAYWRDGDTLNKIPHRFACQFNKNHCRAFIGDTAWSSAFVSYVMKQADIDFLSSPLHFDYIRHSWQNKGDYRTFDPLTIPIDKGDLLCYLRGSQTYHIDGYHALDKYLNTHSKPLPAHCDIAVYIDNTAQEVWLVGGNVVHTVMLRKMPLDNMGKVIFPKAKKHPCTPMHEDECHFNRQNWVVMLKLQE